MEVYIKSLRAIWWFGSAVSNLGLLSVGGKTEFGLEGGDRIAHT